MVNGVDVPCTSWEETSNLVNQLSHYEQLGQEVIMNKQAIIELDERRQKCREAARQIRKKSYETKNSWLCLGSTTFLKVPTEKAAEFLEADVKTIDETIETARNELKKKVDEVHKMEGSKDLAELERRVFGQLFLCRYGTSINRSFGQKPILPTVSDRTRGGEARSFVDFKRVRCKGGDGGNGMVSFARYANVPFGGPDGGDGGNGGHVIFQADIGTKDLSHLPRIIRAKSGVRGMPKGHHGKSAEHLVIKVPLRTSFKIMNEDKVIFNLDTPNSVFLAARGGAGGHGNQFYLTDNVRKPIKGELGGYGEDVSYDIEMRVMAVAGLVGFPNAGKSSLLRAISRANPKVASYPFTTLDAHVGVVHYEDYVQIPVADIPGLIEGSHRNVGLGFDFLRHISRCHCLFFVLDCTLSKPKEQYVALVKELEMFEKDMSLKPSVIVINKVDLVAEGIDESLVADEFAPHKVCFVSAKKGFGLEKLLVHLRAEYDAYCKVLESQKILEKEIEESNW